MSSNLSSRARRQAENLDWNGKIRKDWDVRDDKGVKGTKTEPDSLSITQGRDAFHLPLFP